MSDSLKFFENEQKAQQVLDFAHGALLKAIRFALANNDRMPSSERTMLEIYVTGNPFSNVAIACVKNNPGQKIDAIREMRETTGLGLQEAKAAIEQATRDIENGRA